MLGHEIATNTMPKDQNSIYWLSAEISSAMALTVLYLHNFNRPLIEISCVESISVFFIAVIAFAWGFDRIDKSDFTHYELVWQRVLLPVRRASSRLYKLLNKDMKQVDLSVSSPPSGIPLLSDYMKPEHRFYIFAGISLAAGIIIAILKRSFPIALVSLFFAVGSGIWGRRTEQRIKEKQEIIDDLIRDKSELKEGVKRHRQRSTQVTEKLVEEREEKERIREEKKKKNQRLSNLKRALQRKGIDTDYLIDKYDEALYAPLMVLTHFSAPNNNSKEGATFIKSNLEALDTKMLHGSARIVPPRNFDQDIRSKEGLQRWFDENVLDGRTDLVHKLEAISVVDVSQTFDRDASGEIDGPDFETNTVSDLFETDTVVPTEDLLEILSRSERISLDEELRGNIALLVVPSASETQMDQVLEVQNSLEDSLGELTQIAQTGVDDIRATFANHGIDDAEDLAENVKKEAERLDPILN